MDLQKQNTLPTPATLLEQAIAKGADLSQMKELMDLQERWEKKEAKKAFLDALSLFQAKIPVIRKNKTANITSTKGNFAYRFSDLATITAAIKKALHECGLSYRWEFDEKDGKLTVTCLVSHRDGHTETTTQSAGMDTTGFKNDIQQKGSTQTYLQRYTLIGALGISTADEDNDGSNHPRTGKAVIMTPEQILADWQQKINATTKQVELTHLYVKHKKAVDSSEELKAMFKAREAHFKANPSPNPVTLP